MIELEPNPHLRLKTARKAAGLDPQDLARLLELDPEQVQALESDAEELMYGFEIRQLLRLCRALAIDPRRLFAQNPDKAITPISFATVVAAAKTYMTRHELALDDLAEIVGLEVEETEALLTRPDQILEWSPSVLQDLCDTVGVEWLAVLMDLHAQAGPA